MGPEEAARVRANLHKLLSHEGKCELAEQLAKDELSMNQIFDMVPPKLQVVVKQHFEAVEGISKNPCSLCGTFELEEDYLGSGCCSARCYDEKGRLEADPFPPYEERPRRRYSAVKVVHIGPPVDRTLKAGECIEFDGFYMRAGGKWKEAPMGLGIAIREGWLREIPSTNKDFAEILDGLFRE
jgi:hypothetical protein